MWFHSFTKILLLGIFSQNVNVVSAQQKVSHVILITIDGMRGDMIKDPTMPTVNLKEMKDNGLYVDWIKGVTPAATYPSHTTIITGVRPDEHRIFYNAPFLGNHPRTVSYWYADSIKAETVWQAVEKHGGKVASLFWPVSTHAKGIHYNIPEYWSVEPKVNQMEYLKAHCTPIGLLDSLEVYATGRLDGQNFAAGSVNRDVREAYMTNYIMNKYHPSLLTLHLITTDYAQHQTGLNSERTRKAVESVDAAIGVILDNLRSTKAIDSTAVIVTGDHGFVDVNCEFAPNVWLVKSGLLGEEYGTPWKACFHNAGSMSFLYTNKCNDVKTQKRVEQVIRELPDSTRRLFRILSKEELRHLGCDPKVVLALEPMPGITVSNARKGVDVILRKGGSHGYSTGIDHTALVAYGKGIEKQEIKFMNQTDIKSYILGLLGMR